MCGIAGFASVRESHHGTEAVRSMVSALARRGPDSEGLERWPRAVLGHRRLAIIDLSDAGRQPMLSEDGRIGLVFNGCIYNFQELRTELEKSGRRFRSNTDTEVLLQGYEEWGIDKLVSRLRGMYAFAFWDDRAGRLTLVRDRLGVKPLIYAERGGEIAFASTVRALHDAGFAQDLNADAMLEFFEFGWVSDDHAIYSGVCKVPAATIVEWENGQSRQRCYWTPAEAGARKLSFDDAVEQTEQLLLEAVRLRLIADVPVGSLLSGGIDSALIAWALSRIGADVTLFTVSTPGDPADESPAAAETARLLGVPHQVVALDPRRQPALDDVVEAYGEPFACSSALGMLQVSQAVKPKATVLLTGDGGDDVFLGYTHHAKYLQAQRLARLLPDAAAALWPAMRRPLSQVSAMRRPVHLMDFAMLGLAGVARAHEGLQYHQQRGILGDRLRQLQLSHRNLERTPGRTLMRDFLAYERRTRFVAEYMTKVDGAAMHYALEARSPFLDQELWNFAASLPHELRLRGGELKAILREIVRRRVGPQVASRRKQGFTVPVSNWLAGSWRPQLEMAASESLLESEGWLVKGSFERALQEVRRENRAAQQLWSLVVLEGWMRAVRPQRVGSPA